MTCRPPRFSCDAPCRPAGAFLHLARSGRVRPLRGPALPVASFPVTVTLDDILESMGDEEIELEEIEAVLKRIQRFDPVGVAAKDLRDCLLIQLSQFSKETPWLDEARLIISDHLDLLANHDFRTLMRVTRLKEEVLKEAVGKIGEFLQYYRQ